MAIRWKIPSTLTPRADIVLAGAIQRQQPVRRLCSPKRSVTRCVIEVGEGCFEVVAYGELAPILAGCRSGTFITVHGTLVDQCWKVGSGQQRGAAEIQANQIEVGQRLKERT